MLTVSPALLGMYLAGMLVEFRAQQLDQMFYFTSISLSRVQALFAIEMRTALGTKKYHRPFNKCLTF